MLDRNSNLEIEKAIISESSKRNEKLYQKVERDLNRMKERYAETELEFQKAEIDIVGINEVKRHGGNYTSTLHWVQAKLTF